LTGFVNIILLSILKESDPVIDLENSARYYFLLFGFVPYRNLHMLPVSNQSAFENNIFSDIILSIYKKNFKNNFLIESESRKVGSFFIPQNLFNKLETSPTILIESSFEKRTYRIIKDYFYYDLRGLEPMLNIFTEKEKFFRKELSNKIYNKLLNSLQNGGIEEFTIIMLKEYYDKKYKVKPKIPDLTVNSDNTEEAIKQVKEYLRKKIK